MRGGISFCRFSYLYFFAYSMSMIQIPGTDKEKNEVEFEFTREEIVEILAASKDAREGKNMSTEFTIGEEVVNYLRQ